MALRRPGRLQLTHSSQSGRNVQIDTRWGAGDADRLRRFAAELVALAPDVILASGGSAAGPVLQLTRTVPIVFTQTPDPVGAGYVESLARPGGNATGFTLSEYGISAKLLEALKEIAPSVTRAAVLRDPTIQQGIGLWSAIQTAAPSFGIEVSPISARGDTEFERAVAAFARTPKGGLIVREAGWQSFIAKRSLRWPPGISCRRSILGAYSLSTVV